MSNIKNIPFNLRVGTFRHIVCYIQTKNKHFFSKKKDFIFKNKNKVIDIFLYMNDVQDFEMNRIEQKKNIRIQWKIGC